MTTEGCGAPAPSVAWVHSSDIVVEPSEVMKSCIEIPTRKPERTSPPPVGTPQVDEVRRSLAVDLGRIDDVALSVAEECVGAREHRPFARPEPDRVDGREVRPLGRHMNEADRKVLVAGSLGTSRPGRSPIPGWAGCSRGPLDAARSRCALRARLPGRTGLARETGLTGRAARARGAALAPVDAVLASGAVLAFRGVDQAQRAADLRWSREPRLSSPGSMPAPQSRSRTPLPDRKCSRQPSAAECLRQPGEGNDV